MAICFWGTEITAAYLHGENTSHGETKNFYICIIYVNISEMANRLHTVPLGCLNDVNQTNKK